MFGVLGKETSWNELGLLVKKGLVAIEAIIKSHVFMRVSLGDVHLGEVIFNGWHEYVTRIVTIDSSHDDEFAELLVLVESKFKECGSTNDEDFIDHGIG